MVWFFYNSVHQLE